MVPLSQVLAPGFETQFDDVGSHDILFALTCLPLSADACPSRRSDIRQLTRRGRVRGSIYCFPLLWDESREDRQ